MKPSEVFGICVRVLGLFGLLLASAYIISGITLLAGVQAQYQGITTGQYILFGILSGAIGLYFLRGAPRIIRFAYPQEKMDGQSSNHTSEDIVANRAESSR